MKDFTNVVAFSAQNADLCEAIKEYARQTIAEKKGQVAFAQHSKDEMNKLINKAFAQELVEKSGLALGETKTDIARFSQNPNVQWFANTITSDMIDAVLPIVMENGNLRFMADIKTADLGDSISFDIKSNELFTVSKAGRRKHRGELQKSYDTTVTMTGENHIITTGDSVFAIMTGASNIAEDVMRCAEAMERGMYEEAVGAFTTAVEAVTGNLAVANYSEKAVIKLCERVTALNGGRRAVILGTPVALKNVLPAGSNYRYFLDSEYVKMGHVPQFNGYDVIALDNYLDAQGEYGALKLADDKLYVVSPASDKIAKIGVFGGLLANTTDSTENGMSERTLQKAWNVSAITGSVAGCVTIVEA